ncbi:luciferin sulfotransferase-like [Armigeres subalbatus]|uniref:luciferin sulfotransferase-like n=1 Tax=Armigeres subalbatus TaxID=124917 RepID=UPI002ED067A9
MSETTARGESFSYQPLDTEQANALGCPAAQTFVKVKLKQIAASESPFADGRPWEPKPCVLPEKYQQFAERVRNFPVYDDDVWIITFPKCGTTWTQEMVWLIDHDLDFESATRESINTRSVYLEISGIGKNIPIDSVASAANKIRPRHIKSHLPLALLPKQLWTVKPKIIYVSRNPKDVAVSYWHHYQMIMGYRGPKENFYEALLDDQVIYCPQVQHVLDFWRLRDEDNVLFLTYEQMKRNLRKVLPTVCEFFGKRYSEQQLDILTHHLSFDEMKKNPATNNSDMTKRAMEMNGRKGDTFEFMRKGLVGDYKNELSPELIVRFDQYIEKELKESDFRFEQ